MNTHFPGRASVHRYMEKYGEPIISFFSPDSLKLYGSSAVWEDQRHNSVVGHFESTSSDVGYLNITAVRL